MGIFKRLRELESEVKKLNSIGRAWLDHKGDNYITSKNRLREYKPIPLTEEWLVKLKMEHNESLTKGNGTYWFTLITPHTPITYVHQLQNLYHALTGEELTIKEL